MTKHSTVVEELQRAAEEASSLAMSLISRQVRVTQHPPGDQPVDITQKYADGLRKASDGLNKAAAALKNVDAS